MGTNDGGKVEANELSRLRAEVWRLQLENQNLTLAMELLARRAEKLSREFQDANEDAVWLEQELDRLRKLEEEYVAKRAV